VAGCAEEAAEAFLCVFWWESLYLVGELREAFNGEAAVVVSDAGECFAVVDVEGEAGFGVVGDVVGDEFFEDGVVFVGGGVEVGEEGESEVVGDVGGDHEDDEAAAVFSHVADGVWGRVLGCHDEVGFAFAAGAVEDLDKTACFEVVACLLKCRREKNRSPP